MKFIMPVPCMSSEAIQALLSPLLRDVAVRAAAGLLGAHGVGHVGRERRAAEAARGRRLLLRVDPLAVLVLRGDDDGAGGAGGGDAVAADRAVLGQEVDVVAQGLEVVGRPVAAVPALVVQVRLLLVGLLREVAAEAARRPRGVAGEAAHLVVGVGQLGGVRPRVAPGRAVHLHRLGQPRRLAVASGCRGSPRPRPAGPPTRRFRPPCCAA